VLTEHLDTGQPLYVEWKPEWREFGWEDYLLTSAATAVIVGAQLLPEETEGWGTRGILADEPTRRTLRMRSYHGSLYARDGSDIAVMLAVGYPVLVDSLAVAWWHHGNSQVGVEMALMQAETLAVTSAIQSVVSGLSGRERPYGRRCGGDLADSSLDCKERDRFRSFFSGHTSVSFAAAGAFCSHHLHIPLYGGGGADKLACVLGFANAAAAGTLRIAADRHYLSDVLVGAGLGTFTGFFVPWFLHYRPAKQRGHAASLSLQITPAPGGLGVGGEF
jgi:membrane-associated phospholipid phosphatase